MANVKVQYIGESEVLVGRVHFAGRDDRGQ